MQLTIAQNALLQPLQTVVGVVEKSQTMPILANAHIEVKNNRLIITATNIEVQLQASILLDVDTDDLQITVSARKLLEIVRGIPQDGDITFSFKEKNVELTTIDSHYSLVCLPPSEFPLFVLEEQEQTKISISQSKLWYLIRKTSFSMGYQDVRHYLNGLLFECRNGSLRAISTDGHRLSYCSTDVDRADNTPINAIVPRKGIIELYKQLQDTEELIELQVFENSVAITTPSLFFVCKTLEGEYPNYNDVIPTDNSNELIVDVALLKQKLKITSVLSNDKPRGITISLDANQPITVRAANVFGESAYSSMDGEYQGATIEPSFSVDYVIDVLNAMDSKQCIVKMGGGHDRVLLEEADNQNSRFVIMPLLI